MQRQKNRLAVQANRGTETADLKPPVSSPEVQTLLSSINQAVYEAAIFTL